MNIKKRIMIMLSKSISPDELLKIAASIVKDNMLSGESLTDINETKKYFSLKIGNLEYETFNCVFLDNRHRVIAMDELFRGTIGSASVHPREVVKEALKHNAAAIIFAHNHPSGEPEPSEADRQLTNKLKKALELVDIRVLDHIVIGGINSVSFAERGWI
jgi:DNA repair protein RadC